MAHVRKLQRKSDGGRARHAWQVRYRDPEYVERSRTFAKKADADRFAATVDADIARAEYTDPRLGRVTFQDWSAEWLETIGHLKPKTKDGYESLLRTHILPVFGSKPIGKIRSVDVRRFFSDLVQSGLSVSRMRQVKNVLNMIFAEAVRSRYIPRSPVEGVKLPKAQQREMAFLPAEQVSAIAEQVPERYRALIYLLAYGGLRWGEAAALRRGRCNLLRSRVEVAEAVSEVNGSLHYGPTKTYQHRSIALPAFLRDMLVNHLERFVKDDPEAFVFTAEGGGALRLPNFRRRVWWPAWEAAGLPRMRIHDLRHSCAALLIAQGAHPKAIQQHLGHSSITVTLDRYGHLFPDEMDRLAERLEATFLRARPSPSGLIALERG